MSVDFLLFPRYCHQLNLMKYHGAILTAILTVCTQAADEKAALRREAMAWDMNDNHAHYEIIRALSQNSYKYYQNAVELLVDHKEVCEQLEVAEKRVADAAAAAAAAVDSDAPVHEDQKGTKAEQRDTTSS